MFQGKRIAAIFLSITLITGLFTGCSAPSKTEKTDTDGIKADINVPDYLNATGYPIVKKPLTLKYVIPLGGAYAPPEEMYVLQQMEKKSGIHIEWTTLTEGSSTEKISLMIASNELPDAFYRTNFTTKEIIGYGSQGTFTPLGELIDKYGVNLKSVFARFPDAKKGITAPDGKIYTYPVVNGYEGPTVNNFLWINTKWLANVGMKLPTTTEEFYNVLKAFKTKDPNGNGVADEIPFGGSSDRFPDTLIRGSFGLGTNGGGDYQLDKDGKVVFINIDPRYKETLAYLNKLYAEGLIDKDIFNISNSNGKKKCATGIIGSIYNNNPEVATMPDPTEFEGSPMLKGPNGDMVYSHASGSLGRLGSFAITSACKYPEAAVRWVDYWFSDEGNELLHGGEKGRTYTINAQGNIEYTEWVTKNPDGKTVAQAQGSFTPIQGVPRIMIEKFNAQTLNAPHAKLARSKVMPYVPKEVWNGFMYTEQELDVMTTAAADMEKYAEEMKIKFITGAAPLSAWDDYVRQVKQMGLDKVLQAQQSAYDRYKSVK